MKIFGIVGQPSCGKDTVAEYLSNLGFNHISTGDLIRADMRKLGIPIDRDNMRKFSTESRQQKGAAYPINELSEINSNTVFSGMRNVPEIKALREKFGNNFKLIAVDAPIEIRYARIAGRQREGDQITFEQFKEQEEAERNGNPDAHQVDQVVALADLIIVNDGSKEDLFEKTKKLLEA